MFFSTNSRNVRMSLSLCATGFQKWHGIALWSNGSVVPSFAVTIAGILHPNAYPSSIKQFGRSPVTSTIASSL